MRRLIYGVATSLDGFIAGPNGEFDWIPMDPDIDFAAMAARYDTAVMGRRSYEVARAAEGGIMPGIETYVYSRSMPEGEVDGVTVVRDGLAHVRSLKARPGKDIWLWGGGELFRELAEFVDGVDVAVIPILLGGGLPLLAPPAPRLPLTLRAHKLYPKTGTLFLEYDVARDGRP
jgi:dihydrofolate reductase